MESIPKKKKYKRRIITTISVVLLLTGITLAYTYYKRYFAPNVTGVEDYLYIKTGASFEDIMLDLGKNNLLKDTASFRWAAEKMEYPSRIKPGKYRLTEQMNNRSLINILGGGFQEPVNLRFQNIRLKEQFAGFIATQIEPDSTQLMGLLNSDTLAAKYGFNTENFFTMFIPNTYELYWNTSADNFFSRMHDEYEKFWNTERTKKAAAINLTPIQVSILASVVKGEALHNDEMPKIAGLYINRLRKGILLQADPTVIFATNDFTIRRVLNRHLRTESPYNTYIHKGLPPGPIMMPSITAIDAVLNYENHNYIYMCAKEDFSGYHNFSTNVSEHLVNARKFQQALNERNIKK
ncbi:endolytic transglycosylase MltG [Olivibacter sp. SDN3]|uniref:endolytic transglycosylase MltG n=1 Tax=Olivibacter sp. SDN3 TaxID=2764720 RepID=UPI0016518231|nr:endolytic transglycosylase MltG [Olivibacter sp. SDN3]QNL48974.1 endolytic transglycosylase MltG [Olivibacter sp. SDN3]